MTTKSARTNSRDNAARWDWRKTPAPAGSLKRLSDNDLLKRLKTYRGEERAVLLKILGCINEVERRMLYVPRGYASLYKFCIDVLKYSRSAAMRRIHAARCIERFPQVAALLCSGELTLTVVAMISRILATGNAEEIISFARGRSTRDVEMLVSRHRPGFMLRDRVRPVCLMVPDASKNDSLRFPGAGKNLIQPVDNTSDKNRGAGGTMHGIGHDTIVTDGDASTAVSEDTAHTAVVHDDSSASGAGGAVERVLITQKYKIEFAVDPEFMEKLARIRSLLSTKFPRGMGFEKIFEILINEYLERHDPERRHRRRKTRKAREGKETSAVKSAEEPSGQQKVSKQDTKSARRAGRDRVGVYPPGVGYEGIHPTGGDCGGVHPPGGIRRSARRGSDKRGRYIPQEIRDEVFVRDGGRCTFVGTNGRRCEERNNLQIDHIIPFAKGGANSPENLRLLCFEHNQLAAEKEYGKEHMKKFCRRE